ncbi:hypothetical protein ILYODFUR_002327 [Ilyodon furcidens]|uniref:Uncharacterized protein n=1 Tax=Ilyodon furcidens TaxID=33524 RepID=A0ABV0TFE9_9TELE
MCSLAAEQHHVGSSSDPGADRLEEVDKRQKHSGCTGLAPARFLPEGQNSACARQMSRGLQRRYMLQCAALRPAHGQDASDLWKHFRAEAVKKPADFLKGSSFMVH